MTSLSQILGEKACVISFLNPTSGKSSDIYGDIMGKGRQTSN